jgi:SAM-dependent methyltransferase
MNLRVFQNKRGLEIAGPSEIFKEGGPWPIYSRIAALDDFSFPRPSKWGGRLLRPDGRAPCGEPKQNGQQFVGDTTKMTEIPDRHYDFLIASHVFEHIANPLKAMAEWLRVLRPNGIILQVIPHRDGTFDYHRPVTTLAHLQGDFKRGVGEDDRTHFHEVATRSTKSFSKVWFAAVSFHRGMHHHVFNTARVIEIHDALQLKILAVEPKPPYHIAILTRKTARWDKKLNAAFLSPGASYRKISPFPSDRGERRPRIPPEPLIGKASMSR